MLNETTNEPHVTETIGKCERIGFEGTEKEVILTFIVQNSNNMAALSSSTPGVALITKAEFGCNLFEDSQAATLQHAIESEIIPESIELVVGEQPMVNVLKNMPK